MRILHLTERFAPVGGVETYVINLLPLLESQGHENIVIYRQAHPKTAPGEGNPVHHVPRSDEPARDGEHVLDIIHRERPGVIYLHDTYDPDLVKQVAHTVPAVGYVHIFYPVCPGLGKLYRQNDTICTRPYGPGCVPMIYLRRCASAKHPRSVYRIMHKTKQYLNAYRSLPRVIVASNYMKDLMIQNGIEAKRIELLPPHFIESRDRYEISPPPLDGRDVLFVGRLEYEKGLPYVLEALRLVQPACRLIVAGGGSLRQEHIRMAERMGIAEQVQFLDWIPTSELKALYQRCTVTVMPTIMPEPFGKVGIEAMANGRPVLAFNVGGISDWLQDGHNGFLVPPRDVNQLAKRMNQLLDDRNLADRLGVNGRRYVEEKYSSDSHVEKLTAILETVVKPG